MIARPAPPATDVLRKQATREIGATLELFDQAQKASKRDGVPAWLWLRAARACWLKGDTGRARELYGRAATAWLEVALDAGRRTFTVEQYALLALGAAWMSRSQDLLADVGRQIDVAADQQLTSTDNPPEPLLRATLLLTRVRVAWFRGQTAAVKEQLPELERRLTALDAWGKTCWAEERGGPTVAFLKALYAIRPDPIKQVLQDLDKRLTERRGEPPMVSDLVDEEFISFAAAMRGFSIPLPRVTTPVAPGAFA
jgi:hypothetical protein